MKDDTPSPLPHIDPRETLAMWANENDEWVRRIASLVLSTDRPLDSDHLDEAYSLFRQEKSLDKRDMPIEPKLETQTVDDDKEEPLIITKVSDVHGVNAIASGSAIEPHAGLTILYGENGAGKTGYARVFKTLAASRTADAILSNVDVEEVEPVSAKIAYSVGGEISELDWRGESGKFPFTRMSIFDSRAVNIHVDDDIEYVYTPAVLSLFEHVINGLRGVQDRIEGAIEDLKTTANTPLLTRFPRESSVYPFVETLGAASDLTALRKMASTDSKVDEKIDQLRSTIAALEADTSKLQITARQSAERALEAATQICAVWRTFDVKAHTDLLAKQALLKNDYSQFRAQLFAEADLPADPEETWESFVRAGAKYQQHLVDIDVHDDERCLFCRQGLNDPASDLLQKYGQYIDDKISTDLGQASQDLKDLQTPLLSTGTAPVQTLIAELVERGENPDFLADLTELLTLDETTKQELADNKPVGKTFSKVLPELEKRLSVSLKALQAELKTLHEQSENRILTLSTKREELNELVASAELTKSWSVIEECVRNAKEADRLYTLAKALPTLSRAVTALSKSASNDLVNNSFEELFLEECQSLRAPALKLQFLGREGKAQRRKMIGGKHKPSKVFSEGEQKVLAIADFLAEARLAGIAAPVIFDDPVSSLDHRRIDEVAERIALLAADTQVIVFTHDIVFTTKLLSLFGQSKRCTYLHVTDEGGNKGKVTPATGPRWDSLSKLKGRINNEIQGAEAEAGEARDAHIRGAYSWIRSWCEVFIEQELLQGVTQRLQPNVAMGALSKIKVDVLSDSFNTVNKVFEDACRYIDGHSQPLATLGVAPTLDGLTTDWQTLQDCQKSHNAA
jgi:energy-coupling factor transporter ATP-binding protein EcfA2